MRTELAAAALALALASTARAEEDPLVGAARFSASLAIEAHVVGAAAGVRPEVLWRPFATDGVFHLRAAAAFLPGTEYLYLPAELGVRWRFAPAWFFEPFFGFSVEGQSFWITDGPPAARVAFASELGWGLAVDEVMSVSVAVAPSLAPFGVPGPGLALRALATVDIDRVTAAAARR